MVKSITIFLSLTISIMSVSAQDSKHPHWSKNAEGKLQLSPAGASHFAQLALGCLQKEYPNKLNQVLPDSSMLKEPHELHPVFYGCFDWHSSVHGHWMLARLLRQFPDLPEAGAIRKKMGENLTAANVRGELDYLEQAKVNFPAAKRVLLTAYSDTDAAIKAINDVGLYQYIEKPWENEDLKIVLRNGLEKRILMKRLEDKIAEVNKAHGELMNLQKDILKAFA